MQLQTKFNHHTANHLCPAAKNVFKVKHIALAFKRLVKQSHRLEVMLKNIRSSQKVVVQIDFHYTTMICKVKLPKKIPVFKGTIDLHQSATDLQSKLAKGCNRSASMCHRFAL